MTFIYYIYMISFQLQAASPSRLFLPNLCHGPPRVTYRHSRCGQYSIYIVYVRARARAQENKRQVVWRRYAPIANWKQKELELQRLINGRKLFTGFFFFDKLPQPTVLWL